MKKVNFKELLNYIEKQYLTNCRDNIKSVDSLQVYNESLYKNEMYTGRGVQVRYYEMNTTETSYKNNYNIEWYELDLYDINDNIIDREFYI